MFEHKTEEFDKKEFSFAKKLVSMRKNEDFSSNLPMNPFNHQNIKIEHEVISFLL